ncbi:MAG: ferrochelatase [Bdellovibrionales bacterium]
MVEKKVKAKKDEKVAVVLFNLGGPDSKNAIQPFLMNFFMDKNIIRVPIPFRCFIAAMIARKRSKREAGESYGELGDKSPLLENTNAQAKALEKLLKNDSRGTQKNAKFKTFVCMRYWHPLSPQVVREVRDWGADRIVIVPLYPQFSTTTTWSSLEAWNKAMFQAGYERPTSMVCCYHENKGFIDASVESIHKSYEQAEKDGYKNPRVLFSAHGLPKSVIKEGDPYQWQCEQTAERIAEALKIKDLDWEICYQSRVGPQKWIGPPTDEALKKAADEDKAVVIYPHAFTQEHVETLVELDIEYREEAEEMGLHGYYVAKTVGTNAKFIKGLGDLVFKHLRREKVEAEGFECPCPVEFGQCCMRMEQEGLAEFPAIKKKKAA